MSLKDKVAVVSGGAKGIGRQIVLMLAAEGADIVFTYLKSEKEAGELKQKVEALGRKAQARQLDVRDFSRAKELIEQTREKFGKLDILVNNAGIVKDKALMLMSQQDWQEVLDTDLNGAFNLTRNAIVTFLKQKRGDIINITSITGIIGLARQSNYAAAKAGIIGFTRSLAREVAPYNIRVNAVAPGFIRTDMLSGLKEEYLEQLRENIPLARLGTVEDVAGAVKFLLSQEAGFITGQTIVVDGGLSIR
jgi:3-oxoacyl-[acyl-carrier protein] reductase